MNERILELAEQCTVSCIDGRGVELNEIDVEKFAELIVKEIIALMKETSRNDIRDYRFMGDDTPTSCHVSNIEKHFGVKE